MMTESLIPQSHDKFFRGAFSHRQTAYDFLRYYLPHELSQHFDLATLHISQTSFVDPDLQEYFADVLYEMRLTTGEEFDIYILFEHKSYPDKWTPLQLLTYLTRVWERQGKKGLKHLPPILPLVVYHGETAWPYGTEFGRLFSAELPDALKPYLPNFRYWVLDLGTYPDDEIKGWAILQACLRLLKYVRRREFGEQFEQSVRLLLELPQQETASRYLELLLSYATSSATEMSEDELLTIVVDLIEEGDKLMGTIAEKWFEQGIERGIEQGKQLGLEQGLERGLERGIEQGLERGLEQGLERGIEQGLERGKTEGAAQEALNLLTRTLTRLFGELPPTLMTCLRQLNLEQLRQALDVAFEVATAAEFEATIRGWLPPTSAAAEAD